MFTYPSVLDVVLTFGSVHCLFCYRGSSHAAHLHIHLLENGNIKLKHKKPTFYVIQTQSHKILCTGKTVNTSLVNITSFPKLIQSPLQHITFKQNFDWQTSREETTWEM